MNDNQVNKLRSFMAIEGVIQDEKAIVEKYPLIKNTWDNVNVKLGNVKSVIKDRGVDLSGITLDKNQARDNMAKLTAKIAGCASSYAKQTNNLELATICNVRKDTILKYSEENAVGICTKIFEECEKHKEALVEYMVRPEDFANLKGHIKKFETMRSRSFYRWTVFFV